MQVQSAGIQVVTSNIASARSKSNQIIQVASAYKNRQTEAKSELSAGIHDIVDRTISNRDQIDRITKDPVYLERKPTSQFGKRWPIP